MVQKEVAFVVAQRIFLQQDRAQDALGINHVVVFDVLTVALDGRSAQHAHAHGLLQHAKLAVRQLLVPPHQGQLARLAVDLVGEQQAQLTHPRLGFSAAPCHMTTVRWAMHCSSDGLQQWVVHNRCASTDALLNVMQTG